MKILLQSALLAAALVMITAVQADDRHKPFILASTPNSSMAETIDTVATQLENRGFEVVGRYSPYPSAVILAITSDALKQAASRSGFGGYGAVQRVSITQVEGQVQVAYTNPTYMAHAYRMDGDLADVSAALAETLGRQQAFGMDKGMEPRQLRRYRYMVGMERFDKPSVLAKYDSQEAALAAVEAGLARGDTGVSKVYRVDVPGKAESVFGVALQGEGDDQYRDDTFIMSEIDFMPVRSSAHLPYEMLVSDGTVYALYARFRIAINFPDLSMMGDNSFMRIRRAPDAIEDALRQVATQ